jgi:hypothetical protein
MRAEQTAEGGESSTAIATTAWSPGRYLARSTSQWWLHSSQMYSMRRTE